MKQKGFTLMELLAVVVVLAIILIIATPVILGVIEKAKKGAKEQSALGYMDAIEKKIAISKLDMNGMAIDDGIYSVGEIQVDYKGRGPSEGNYVIEKGILTKGIFLIDKYYICYVGGKVTSSKEKDHLKDCRDVTVPAKYEEPILNGAYPEIRGDLIAVTIENNGEVKRANLKTSWYSYKDKKWANAVILLDKTVTYQEGETIPESNIESYFVWVPRYRYKIFHLGEETSVNTGKPTEGSRAQEIEIIFESKEIAASTGTKIGEYVTHPAYTTMNTNGIWVGKFETGYKGATTEAMAQVNSNDSKQIIVKPNSYSWRGNIVKNMFEAAYNYNRPLESHMMKNTEWGAVAYLSHSKYGINKEININNNSSYLTGYSAVEGTDQTSYPGTSGTDSSVTLPYQTPTGYKASTTGNITGIYDMSGGANEYVSTYIATSTDGHYGSSGFDATSISKYDSKYFDIYPISSLNGYNNRILGDATGEMGSFYNYLESNGSSFNHNNWYADVSDFIEPSFPCFFRSGHYNYGVLASQFAFGRYTCDVGNGTSSRLVLVG